VKARAGGAPIDLPKQIRTEGQRLFLKIGGTLTSIAQQISPHVSAQNVLDWRSGVRPRTAQRAEIFAAFRIPVAAWSERPSVTEPNQPPQLPPPPEPEPGGTTLEDCMRLLRIVRADQAVPNILPTERVRLMDAETRILKFRADLEARAELSEDRYVREHPAWLRARNVISSTLKQYPEAARAVAEALERLGL
jgi:hypothetical protein